MLPHICIVDEDGIQRPLHLELRQAMGEDEILLILSCRPIIGGF